MENCPSRSRPELNNSSLNKSIFPLFRCHCGDKNSLHRQTFTWLLKFLAIPPTNLLIHHQVLRMQFSKVLPDFQVLSFLITGQGFFLLYNCCSIPQGTSEVSWALLGKNAARSVQPVSLHLIFPPSNFPSPIPDLLLVQNSPLSHDVFEDDLNLSFHLLSRPHEYIHCLGWF